MREFILDHEGGAHAPEAARLGARRLRIGEDPGREVGGCYSEVQSPLNDLVRRQNADRVWDGCSHTV